MTRKVISPCQCDMPRKYGPHFQEPFFHSCGSVSRRLSPSPSSALASKQQWSSGGDPVKGNLAESTAKTRNTVTFIKSEIYFDLIHVDLYAYLVWIRPFFGGTEWPKMFLVFPGLLNYHRIVTNIGFFWTIIFNISDNPWIDLCGPATCDRSRATSILPPSRPHPRSPLMIVKEVFRFFSYHHWSSLYLPTYDMLNQNHFVHCDFLFAAEWYIIFKSKNRNFGGNIFFILFYSQHPVYWLCTWSTHSWMF